MKLSLVVEGGGIRVNYSLGAMHALISHFGLKRVDYVTGSSSSLGLLAYYTTGQFYPAYYEWPQELSNYKLLSLRNLFRGKSILDIDYLIDEIYKKHVPLNEKKIKSSKIRFFVPLTNAKTGKTVYLDNKSKFNFFEILRAGMAMQIAYGKTVKLGKDYYFDAGISDPLPLDIPEIKKSKKIIILTKKENIHLGHWSDNMFIKLFKWKFSSIAYKQLQFHANTYENKTKQVKKLKSQGDIVIQPKIRFSRYDRNIRSMKKMINQGYNDTIKNKKLVELVDYLKKSNKYKHYFI